MAQSSSFTIADSLYALGNYSQAINNYTQSNDQNASLQIARSYNALGRFDKAIAQYEDIVAKNPEAQIAGFELGKLYLKTNAYEEGRKLFSKLIAKNDENPEYYYYLGEIYTELDQPASSLNSYKKAIKNDSTHLRSLFQLGKYFVTKREKETALTYLNQGLAVYPDDVSLINLQALAYYNNDEYQKALPLFERLVELGEVKEFIYEKLAYCYFKNWEFEKAKSAYKTVIHLNDENSEAYFNLGQVFLKDRQIDSAQYYIQESIAVQKPFLAEEYVALAGIARNKDNIKSAFEYYKLAHQEDPDDAFIYYNVCTVADKLYEDPKTKLQFYEKFVGRFAKRDDYMGQMVAKRISQLKEEIHFLAN